VAEADILASETEQARACCSTMVIRLASVGLTTCCQSAAGAQTLFRTGLTPPAVNCSYASLLKQVMLCWHVQPFFTGNGKAKHVFGASEDCEDCSKG